MFGSFQVPVLFPPAPHHDSSSLVSPNLSSEGQAHFRLRTADLVHHKSVVPSPVFELSIVVVLQTRVILNA